MKKILAIVLCVMLLPLSVFAYANSDNNIKLENIIEEYTELYSNCKDFEEEAKAMNMSIQELILNKANKAYEVRKILFSKKTPMVATGNLYYANVPVIEQTQTYNCGPTSGLQVLYALGDESNVNGDTNKKKIEQLEKDMKCIDGEGDNGGTTVGNLVAGLNKYASSFTYSHYNTSEHIKTKEKLEEKMANSLTFDVAPILNSMTGKFKHYGDNNNYGHYIAVSSVNTSTHEVVIKDCTYVPKFKGTFKVTLDEVYNSISGGRRLICLTQ